MPRRSTRSSATSTPAKSIGSATKRARATPTESKYFSPRAYGGSRGKRASYKEEESSEDELSPTKKTTTRRVVKPDDEDEDEDEDEGDEDGAEDDDVSVFGEDDADAGLEDEDDDEDEELAADSEEYASDDDVAPATKKRKMSKSKSTPVRKGQELWRTNVKTGLGPGNEVIIQRPKARPAGKTPYLNHTIHPNTFLFLRDLAQNNDREWLKMHDPDYRTSWKDFTEWLESLQEKIIAEADETIPELPIKDVIFRIYRDVRFSSDQTPYKTHFSAAWSRTGRKGPFAAYYVQIKPGESFVGGGLWMPEAAALARLRRDVDRRPHRLKAVLLDAGIRKNFLNGVGADEKKVVKAFVGQNAGNALKTKPKGFDADHPNVDILRLRNFTMGKKISDDDDIIGDGGLDHILSIIKALVPFIAYLNSVVMPDDPEEESGSDEDADETTA